MDWPLIHNIQDCYMMFLVIATSHMHYSSSHKLFLMQYLPYPPPPVSQIQVTVPYRRGIRYHCSNMQRQNQIAIGKDQGGQ